jgi:hypothetical protein
MLTDIADRPGFEHTIDGLVELAMERAQVEKQWLTLAIAQRSKAEESLRASIV